MWFESTIHDKLMPAFCGLFTFYGTELMNSIEDVLEKFLTCNEPVVMRKILLSNLGFVSYRLYNEDLSKTIYSVHYWYESDRLYVSRPENGKRFEYSVNNFSTYADEAFHFQQMTKGDVPYFDCKQVQPLIDMMLETKRQCEAQK